MAQIVSDDFHRVDAATLGANYTKCAGDLDISIVSNQANCPSAGSIDTALYTGAAWTGGADQYAEGTVQAQLANDDGGPIVRGATGAQTSYLISANDSDSIALGSAMTFNGYSRVANVFTVIITGGSQVVSAGDVLRMEAQGTTIRIFHNGVSQGSVTNSALASGNPGLYFSGNGTANGMQYSSFAAGDFSTGSAVTALLAHSRPFPFRPGSPNRR